MVVALGTLVVPFDSSVNFAFPFITRAFGLPIPAIQWVVIAYTLTYAALMLVFGRVGDMLGYRRIFLIGSLWSAVAFVLCASASSYPALLAARVMQGIGAALVLSCGPALATSLHHESHRTRILAIYTMAIGLGGALGPLIAGLLVPLIDWPAVFWFRAPLALSAFLLGWLLPRDTRPAHREPFDAAGGVLLVLAISAMLLALNQMRAHRRQRLAVRHRRHRLRRGDRGLHRAGAADAAADHQPALLPQCRFLAAEWRPRSAQPGRILGAAAGAVPVEPIRRAVGAGDRTAAGLLARRHRARCAARRPTHVTRAATASRACSAAAAWRSASADRATEATRTFRCWPAPWRCRASASACFRWPISTSSPRRFRARIAAWPGAW
ncbi:MAG: MFS transporter [Acetobacteraceae bacterium]